MSNTIENAVVERVNRTEGPGGKWKKVSVQVKGNWYSGFVNNKTTDDRTKVAEGDIVTLDYVQSGRFFNIENLKVTGNANKVTSDVVSVSVGNSTATVSEYVPANVRDFRITVAAARNAAIEFVKLALDKGALTLGAGKKKGEQVDTLLAHVNNYTEVFANQMLNADPNNILGQSDVTAETTEEEEYSE